MMIKGKRLLTTAFIAILALVSTVLQAQECDRRYSELMGEIYKYRELPTNELILKIALLREGTPYVAGTLEGEKEELIIKLDETDCILFVESCFALAQTAKSTDTSYTNFCKNIRELRYRNGVVDGYPSRIHYTSEWIQQAEKRGLVKEVSKEIAGTPLNQKFSFMTEKAERYSQLAGNPANIEKIAAVENQLNSHQYHYIPKSEVPQFLEKLQPGDMIGFCTSIKGLDLTHVGIVIEHNGKMTFIHASMGAMKVVIDHKSIVEYINGIKNNIGIRIIRPVF